jgi:outer membrane receptor protein involved in Fe transport
MSLPRSIPRPVAFTVTSVTVAAWLIGLLGHAHAAPAPAPAPAGPPPAATPAAPAPADAQKLDTINVRAKPYEPLVPAMPKYLWFLRLGAMGGGSIPNLSFNRMGTMVVTATRTPVAPDRVTSTLKLLGADTMRTAPTLTLDGALRSVPGFSLFRRSDSFTANPTAQGVSLRGLGPSGASRSLVLLDGVPLNDPFGGWVAWTKLPRDGIGSAEVLPGGGATAWGNAALGGVVHLFTAPIKTTLEVVDQPPAPIGWTETGSLRVTATLGDFRTRSAELGVVVPVPRGAVQLLGRDFSTDGFALVAPERRGPIDIPAWSRHRWLTGRWRHKVGQTMALMATAPYFEEKRGNGTPYQQNGSREKFASASLAGQPLDHFGWNAIAYVQDQSFASTFSSVNATRTAETPASDQFAVPSTAWGTSWTGAWTHAAGVRTNFGADARMVKGETREHFTFTNGAFTRLRVAGGRQAIAGLFALHEQPLGETLRATLGARLDSWRETDGHRTESDRATGVASRQDRYADRDGTSVSPSAGVLWTPAEPWRVRASVQKGFRRPTLNELYRPFRVGPNITEANAALGTEKVTSGEVGVEWTLFAPPPPPPSGRSRNSSPAWSPSKPGPLLVLGATGFTNELRDAVGNVTLARGPGTYPLFGFIAAGGVGRQRLNLERIRVRGVEGSARWYASPALTISGDFLYNEATVRRSSLAPGLVGNQLAQVPRRTASLGATWQAPGRISVLPRVRWIDRQFEDDENQLRLGAVAIGDLSLSRPLTKNLAVFLTAENIGNARIETGRTADGLVNIGTPRLVVGGLRGSW